MRAAIDLREKEITDLFYVDIPYEDDKLGKCTECDNEDVLYFLNEADQVCYDCFHKHYKEGGTN